MSQRITHVFLMTFIFQKNATELMQNNNPKTNWIFATTPLQYHINSLTCTLRF